MNKKKESSQASCNLMMKAAEVSGAIKKIIDDKVIAREPCQLIFTINLTQGGFSNCKFQINRSLL